MHGWHKEARANNVQRFLRFTCDYPLRLKVGIVRMVDASSIIEKRISVRGSGIEKQNE